MRLRFLKALRLETGLAREEGAQLEGRAYKTASLAFSSAPESTDDRLKLEWVICAPDGGRGEVGRASRPGWRCQGKGEVGIS